MSTETKARTFGATAAKRESTKNYAGMVISFLRGDSPFLPDPDHFGLSRKEANAARGLVEQGWAGALAEVAARAERAGVEV